MNNSIYKINKGINKPIEFRGLKAQYIGYLGIGVVVLLIVFAILYISGINMFICLGVVVLLTVILFMGIYQLSNTFGQHGLTKRLAKRNIPDCVTCRSRRIFLTLHKNK